MHEELHSWGEFYLVVGGAAAALTGLMFVVVSIGPRTLNTGSAANTRAFVTPTVVFFSTVLVAAGFMTVPSMSAGMLTALLALGGLLGLGYMAWVRGHRLWHDNKLELDDWVCFVGLPIGGYLLLLAASVQVWMHGKFALETVAAAMILFLAVGIRNAWDLVLWMAQQERA